MLKIALSSPQSVTIGEPAPHVIRISNPGTGVARNVSVQAMIPEGLEHRRGSRLVMDIGPLSPGESRDVRLALTAVAGGEQQLSGSRHGRRRAELRSSKRGVGNCSATVRQPGRTSKLGPSARKLSL